LSTQYDCVYLARPVRHDVRRRRPEVDVVRDGGENDRGRDERHREQQVLRQQRNDQRVLRNDLGQHQEEDGERQQDVDAQRHLLVAVGRYVEDEDRDEGVRDERDDEVDGVEEELAADDDVEAPHRERLVAAGVTDASLLCRGADDVELGALVELAQVDADVDALEHILVTLQGRRRRYDVRALVRLVIHVYIHLFATYQQVTRDPTEVYKLVS